ncbi:MAG: cell envelope biogenesis protein OmpA [Rhodobacteraceae bacterium]|jgi:phosphate transport system substrate-binding protein|uniref:Phosphate ABC transporter substrate-binding protein, PhoT family n=1 Tax=Salipiger profundus TaxID=1229727 RepID=A0A1U7D307_9RHOB|nr:MULTISPECIES: phosphate ABC transporter substrate-binding/OmpA family protein [Salipiger]APX22465.1 phosphate ABC transporter substrate-binding protein, PhoT family [Salipiger profundus]MAB09207.1 cell envelope biogenesis protein OmpA [Paracoccaceae bacterium]GGA26895.1 OmpA family protein [Salipiger profundus]SFD87350.1 phosphate ABC transporter substrate-binding protein, PhoT family [Salipiger profundus]
MKTICAAVLAALCLFGGPLRAQDITLRSRDGGIELSGTLLGFDGEFYRMETRYGELTVDSSGVLCEGVGCPSLTDFVAEMRVSGSAAIGDVLMPALVEGFALRNGLEAAREDSADGRFRYLLTDPSEDRVVGRFSFRSHTTNGGFADLLSDEADVVMALREVRPQEREQAEAAGLGDLSHPNRSRVLALDAMIPVVAHGNPVDAISLSALARMLSGRLVNWRALGGPDAPVVLHLRNAGSGLAQGLEDRLLRPSGLELNGEIVRHESNAVLSEAVADDPFGIGLASYSEIGNTKPLSLTGSCGFQLRGRRTAIKTEDYPLTAPIFLYMPARRLPALAREFLAYTRSPPAQIVIRRAGFVDQAPEEIEINAQGNRLANAIAVAQGQEGLGALQSMVTMLAPMRRLTTSFRFETGSVRLDAQSRSNVQQLARSLELGEYDGRRMVFVGFSDGQGPADDNLEIARARAEAVRDAVIGTAETADLDRLTLETVAFGEAMPMACDDTVWGRRVNRRVEVWLR